MNLRSFLAKCLIGFSTLIALPNFAQQSAENSIRLPSEVSTEQFSVHGLSQFSSQEKSQLSTWLKTGVRATRLTLGVYPTPLKIYLQLRRSDQPVPWAHTRRDENESIYFYVDPTFSIDDFINDWTIYHEMAHLAIPYLGGKYSWFSEGFASFMQYQLMRKIGKLPTSINQAYEKKITPHLSWFWVNTNAALVARTLMNQGKFPAAYWGGAWFFVLADNQLQTLHGTTLTAVISQYQHSGRTQDQTIHELLTSLDNIINDSLFSDLLRRFEQEPASNVYPKVIDLR